MRAVLLALLLPAGAALADSGLALHFGRATGGKDVDVARVAYRHGLQPDARAWWPTHVQLGASTWWVPDVGGTRRRHDLNVTALWRKPRAWGYFEAGFGPYVLSSTINNRTTRLPSELQFGSHVGIGWRMGARATAGLALQHISNAGIEQPNGGIDFVQMSLTLAL